MEFVFWFMSSCFQWSSRCFSLPFAQAINWNILADLAVVPDRCFSAAELVRYRLLTAICVQMLLKPMSDGHRQPKAAFGKMVLGGCGRQCQK